ncbi:MAG TPA: hypothetical protein VM284_05485 [Candidatus Limnocylindria bacterium]|nr:hypothetical protein [Candidatus Limnocylindria bacterium]
MSDQPASLIDPSDTPRYAVGLGLGWVAAAAFTVVYALSAELIGLTFGLPIVALLGGWIIGTAVAYGGWGELEHLAHRGLRLGAVSLAVEGWLLGLIVAYILSQVFIPQASTALSDRLTLSGFFDYFLGLDFALYLHLLALPLAALMAWRAAR